MIQVLKVGWKLNSTVKRNKNLYSASATHKAMFQALL